MYVIGVTNNKGGGTKTTIANNLTIYFRENGLNVLLIDFDPQANTSSLYNPTIDNSTYDLLNGVPIEECIGNDLIKADESVALLEQMVSQGGYEYRLKKALKKVSDRYDICIIDLPPLFGVALRNTLLSCDGIIIPAEAAEFASQGIDQTLNYIQEMNEAYSINVNVLGVVLSKAKMRSNEQKAMRLKIENIIAGRTKIFTTMISESDKIPECQRKKVSLFQTYPSEKVTIQTESFCKEVLLAINSDFKLNDIHKQINNALTKNFEAVTEWVNLTSLKDIIAMQEEHYNKSYNFDVYTFVNTFEDTFRSKMILFFIAAYKGEITCKSYFTKVFNSRYYHECDNEKFLEYCFTQRA